MPGVSDDEDLLCEGVHLGIQHVLVMYASRRRALITGRFECNTKRFAFLNQGRYVDAGGDSGDKVYGFPAAASAAGMMGVHSPRWDRCCPWRHRRCRMLGMYGSVISAGTFAILVVHLMSRLFLTHPLTLSPASIPQS